VLVSVFRLVRGFFTPQFFLPVFFAVVIVPLRFFATMFRTPFPRGLVAGRLDPAQGAPEIFNLPFIANFLFFRQFNQFQNVLHLFKGFFERFHDSVHFIHGLGE
jgi:hypothetical protein